MQTHTTDNQLRSDFEVSLLFNNFELPNETQLGPDGLYLNRYVEAAWRGFQMLAADRNDLIARMDPDRYVAQPMLALLKKAWGMGPESNETVDAQVHNVIKTVLQTVRGFPV